MSDRAADHFEDQERREKTSRLMCVAAQIRNDLHLQSILLNIEASERRGVYDSIKPHLQFKPLSFRRLMRLYPHRSELVN
jgi:hypothetical protein